MHCHPNFIHLLCIFHDENSKKLKTIHGKFIKNALSHQSLQAFFAKSLIGWYFYFLLASAEKSEKKAPSLAPFIKSICILVIIKQSMGMGLFPYIAASEMG